MGIDIIMFGEHRTPEGTWEVIGDLIPNDFSNAFDEESDCPNGPRLVPQTLDIPRCTALFSILADVQNVRTSEPYEPISLPRGLPKDASSLSREWHSSWKGDALAASWLTITEIDAYDWQRVKQLYGTVDTRAEHLFRSNPFGFPIADWPKGVDVGWSWHASDIGNAKWRETYAMSAGFREFRTLLKQFETFDDARLVFWFYN